MNLETLNNICAEAQELVEKRIKHHYRNKKYYKTIQSVYKNYRKWLLNQKSS